MDSSFSFSSILELPGFSLLVTVGLGRVVFAKNEAAFPKYKFKKGIKFGVPVFNGRENILISIDFKKIMKL